jgi:endonuclease-3 related protein
MVGAILTQNTAWTNASRAISHLKEDRLLDPVKLTKLPLDRLASLIRSSGYFNQKAKRLKVFVKYLQDRYGGEISQVRRTPWPRLRKELLNLPGIGPETADSILLYALNKTTFVVDAYTRRILARHSWISWDASYEEIQDLFMKYLPVRVSLFNEYHALLVVLGKELCQVHPKCHRCPLRDLGTLRLETAPAPPDS